MAYNVQTAVDGDHALIVDFEVVNTNDRRNMHHLAAGCKEVLGTDRLTSLADKGYLSATDIAKCVMDGITANVCMDEENLDFCIETEEEAGKPLSYHNGRILYLEKRNLCVCPMGEVLYPGSYRKKRHVSRCYNTKACAKCTQKCTDARFTEGEVAMKKESSARSMTIKTLSSNKYIMFRTNDYKAAQAAVRASIGHSEA